MCSIIAIVDKRELQKYDYVFFPAFIIGPKIASFVNDQNGWRSKFHNLGCADNKNEHCAGKTVAILGKHQNFVHSKMENYSKRKSWCSFFFLVQEKWTFKALAHSPNTSTTKKNNIEISKTSKWLYVLCSITESVEQTLEKQFSNEYAWNIQVKSNIGFVYTMKLFALTVEMHVKMCHTWRKCIPSESGSSKCGGSHRTHRSKSLAWKKKS